MYISAFLFFSEQNFWIFKILITFLLLIFFTLAFKFLLKAFEKRWERKRDWRKNLDYIFLKPLQALLWVLGILYILSVISRQFKVEFLQDYLWGIKDTVLVFCIAWLVLRWKKAIVQTFLIARRKRAVDSASLEFMSKIIAIMNKLSTRDIYTPTNSYSFNNIL